MADIRAHPEQEEEHEGASSAELLIEAARRNNVDLLNEVIDGKSEEEVTDLLNNTKTVLGNHLYHEAALQGNYEIIDALLDQPNFECDPVTRSEHDTPLHSAIRYFNELYSTPSSANNPDVHTFTRELLTMMIESGSDYRLKNKANLTPYQLAAPTNLKLRDILQEAIDMEMMKGDFIQEDEGENDDDDVGSASDSDFDLEDYRKEKERREKERK